MSKFYKCKVFEYTDIIEVDGKATRHIYKESEENHGIYFIWGCGRYILCESDYSSTQEITREEAVYFLKDHKPKDINYMTGKEYKEYLGLIRTNKGGFKR